MKLFFKVFVFISFTLIVFQGCVSDGKSSANKAVQESNELADQKKVQTATADVDHSGHDHSEDDHSGHDHSAHDGHNHGTQKNQPAPKRTAQKKKPVTQEAPKTVQQKIEEAKNTADGVSQSQLDGKVAAIKNAAAPIAAPVSVFSLSSACDLVTDKFIANTLGVDVAGITIKDGSSQVSPHARSCFFRWAHKGVPNSGVLVQVQENPLPDEIDEWAAYYIQAKLNQGEIDPNGTTYKYKPFDGMGVAGAYNYEMHRYLWRNKAGNVFMIAFNIYASEKEELEWARIIGKEMIKNF